MKIRAKGDGAALVFDEGEADALMQLFADQSGQLAQLQPGDPRWERLHPAAFEDPQDAHDFRSMVDGDLDTVRTDRIGTCVAELTQVSPKGRRRSVLSLDAEALERWIATVNDLRLMRGTALGVTADDSERWDPRSPDFAQWMAYHWLTSMQDALVNAAMR